MAVVAVWKCDRDGTMFEDKKEAEEHDKMLELAENIAALLRRNISDIDSQLSEKVGRLLARHRDVLAKACKGKPEVLLTTEQDEGIALPDEENNVAPLAASH